MFDDELNHRLSYLARGIGLEIRSAINALPLERRTETRDSILKGSNTVEVDVLGEEVAIAKMKTFGDTNDLEFRIIIDPSRKEFEKINRGNQIVYVIIDPVDGTIKIAGLENEPGKLRIGNDGAWASGISFAGPTNKGVQDLIVSDFRNSAIVDGNPRLNSISPDHAYTIIEGNTTKTYERLERPTLFGKTGQRISLATSTQENLRRAFLALDDFQAYDAKTAEANCEKLAEQIRKKLGNRNKGGAFDISHIYGTASEFLTQMLARPGLEPQTVGRIALNDHFGNNIPIYSIMLGAGGEVVDLSGRDLGTYNLMEPRPNVLAVANSAIKKTIMQRLSSPR